MLKLVKTTKEGLLHQKQINAANALAIYINAAEDSDMCWEEAYDLDDMDDIAESERMVAEMALVHDTRLFLWRNYLTRKRELLRELNSG